jgi:hypothetical protein
MKVEEAVKILKTEHLGDSEKMELAKQMGAVALDKLLPQKPCFRSNILCCECGEKVKRWYSYCPECGQALDWSNEK